MIRYFNSFIITSLIYTLLIGSVIYFYSNQKLIINEKKELLEKRKISLNHIELVKKVEKIEKLEKKVEKKLFKKKAFKKKTIVKKQNKKEVKEISKKVAKKIEKPIIEEVPRKAAVAQTVDYKDLYFKKNLLKIKKEIQKCVKYSKRARRMGIQGKVFVEFKLLKNGLIKDIKTLEGHKMLRKSTIRAINEAAIYFPKVKKDLTIRIPIEYRLI